MTDPGGSSPRYFADARAWRDWLQAHAATAAEVIVGFRKVATTRKSGGDDAGLRWPESVDEALCFGWIDGVRKRIDDAHYQIRFTPRRPGSIWSRVNIDKVERLQAEGRMTPAGLAAFALRRAERSAVYSYEQDPQRRQQQQAAAALSPAEERAFRRDQAAWTFFNEGTPPSYRKTLLHWICSAKKAETRAARLAKLVEACARGERLE